MPKRIRIALRIATSVLVFSGYLALASVANYGMMLLVPPIIIVFFSPIGERLDAKYPGYQTILRAIQIAYACFIPLSYIALGLLLGVISLVMFIQAILLVRRRNEREYYYVFMMAFFLLLAACVSAPEPMIAIAIILFLLSSIWCFILIRFQIEFENTPINQPEIETISGSVTRQGKSDNLFDAGLVGTLIAICFVSMIITSGLFLVIPRVEAGFLGSSELPVAASKTGAGSDHVDVASGLFGIEDPSAVMYVKFPELEGGQYPVPSQLYWRLFSLARYNNASWSRADMSEHWQAELPRQPFDGQFSNALEAGRNRSSQDAELLLQEIYLDSIPEEGLPALNLVQKVSLDQSTQGNARVSWDMDAMDFSLKLIKRGARALNYVAWSEPPNYTTESLRNAPLDYEYVAESDLRMLTDHDLLPQTQEMVANLIVDAPSLYDKVKTIESYLSGSTFTYTLIVPPLPPDHPVDAFLNDVRRGHCERFATAMALMLRSQGIPARVVSGFRGGDWDESGASYIIRNSMAHLWVEVLFPQIGWVVFDPSPRADESELAMMKRISMMYANYALRAKIFWYQNVIQFDRGIQLSSLREIGMKLFSPFQQLSESTLDFSKFSRFGGRMILILLLIITLVPLIISTWQIIYEFPSRPKNISFLRFILWRWQTRHLKSKYKLTYDQMLAVRLFQLLRHKMQRLGIDCRAKSAEDLLRDLQGKPWSDDTALRDTLTVYNESRFGLRPLRQAEFQHLRIRLKNLRFLPKE